MKKFLFAPSLFFLIPSLSPLLAQTAVTGEKTADEASGGVKYYGSVQLRQQEIQLFNGNKREQTVSLMSIAPGLGAQLLNDRVDTFFRIRYGKSNTSEAVQSVEAFNETFVYLYKNDFMNTGPYAFTSFDPSSGQYQGTNIGYDVSGTYTLETSFGGFKLSGYGRPQVKLESQGSLAENKKAPKAAPGQEVAEIERRHMAYINEMELAATYSPSFVKDFSLSLIVYTTQEWNPVYKVNEDEGAALDNTDFDGYKRSDLSVPKAVLSYQLTQSTKFDGEVRQYYGGFFGYPIDEGKSLEDGELTAKRMESRLSLTTAF